MTDLAPMPTLAEPGTDPDETAHIVWPDGAARVTEARAFGLEVVALCGYRWIPHRDPLTLPVCAECADIMHRMTGDRPAVA